MYRTKTGGYMKKYIFEKSGSVVTLVPQSGCLVTLNGHLVHCVSVRKVADGKTMLVPKKSLTPVEPNLKAA